MIQRRSYDAALVPAWAIGHDRQQTTFEGDYYQCQAYHQYGKTACVSTCLSEQVARSAVEHFLAHLLAEGLDLHTYLQDTAKEMATDEERLATLKAELQEADTGLRRVADAVAIGALDLEQRARRLWSCARGGSGSGNGWRR